ncbi:MAG: Stp1/IreP family PP2C-type Ser/Thr phosphatase [Thermodesulfobacteriota bacterium]|nr:Stp1/IreP family PP2C-type Ser/Thr phosphatase [Thermodesulfobacteriota bacterium]
MSFITIAAATDPGLQRTNNQDYHAYYSPDDVSAYKKGVLLILADGMGGHSGGEIASKTAVDVLMKEYYKDNGHSIRKSLEQAFLKANKEVLAKGQDDIRLKGMGSTLTAVVVKNDKMLYAHVGDSRGYIIHDNKISQFTEDHSYVASLVKVGVISEEEALTHPERNIITRGIGIKKDLKIDMPETYIKTKKGQYILLCCDGLWGVVPNDEILSAIYRHKHPNIICDKLVEEANKSGGPDNITVLVARIERTSFMSNLIGRCKDFLR